MLSTKAIIFVLIFGFIKIDFISSQQLCRSRYAPYYNGTCMNINTCKGAILANLCPDQPGNIMCCIPETSSNPVQNFVSESELNSVIGFLNTRLRHIAKIIMRPTSNPTCHQKSAFLSQLLHESANFILTEETGPDSYFDMYEPNTNTGQEIGNTQPGDGMKYRGRGFIHLTGRYNYRIAGQYLGLDLENSPEMAAFPSVAAEIAVFYFANLRGYDLNQLADGTFYGYSMLTFLINKGLKDMDKRVNILEKFLTLYNCGQLLKGKGEECSLNGQKGFCKPLCTSGLEKSYCGCNGNSQRSIECKNPLGGQAPSNIQCCIENCANEMDLTFVLDSSGSISRSDFQKSLLFTRNIVDNLEIGENKTRVGIINFSSYVQKVTQLNSIFSKSQLLSTISAIGKINSGTNTGEALKQTQNIYRFENGARNSSQGISKIVLVLTDGASNGAVRPEPVATTLKSMGITIISIGVGSNLNLRELNGISSPGRTYLIDSFSNVLALFNEIKQTSCLVPANIPALTAPISVGREEIKYFSYQITDPNTKTIKILLNIIFGSVRLFLSFTNQNPNDFKTVDEQMISKRQIRNSASNTVLRTLQVPTNNTNNQTVLYLGVKGLVESNSFVIQINESLFIEFENIDDKICEHYLNSGVKCDSGAYISNMKFSEFCRKLCNDSAQTSTTATTTSTTFVTTTKTETQSICINYNDVLCNYFVKSFDLCNLNSFISAIPFRVYCCDACKSKN